MRNGDNGLIFECENSILLRTQHVSTLSELKSLILNNLGGIETREVGRMGYRLLLPMGNGVFQFRLFRLLGGKHVQLMFDIHEKIMAEQVMELSVEVGDVDRDGFVHSTYVQDDRPLALPPHSCRHSSGRGWRRVTKSLIKITWRIVLVEDFVPETPAETAARHVLPPPTQFWRYRQYKVTIIH
ncbi:hypothetical protein Ahy_B08g093304 isoform B [Arachis hypogaea]|uniref:Uncharacterized protein n=1 Tax=Arachis hypogaea TaxID=3818 RepID=A0A444Y5P0_ARAHY|nr:hypothetical protein Ahy_B08g093304 isoform B [Arachis hypogaea]